MTGTSTFLGQGTTDLRTLTFSGALSTTGLILYSSPVAGSTVTYTVSVKEAAQDRSVNANGLQVFGTVTKTAVATGADLVGYHMDNSNYLKQLDNSDLDFGTGDFSVNFWTYEDVVADHNIIYLGGSTPVVYPANGLYLWMNGGYIKFSMGSAPYHQVGGVPYGVWNSVALVRRSGIVYLYLNGVEKGSFDKSTVNVNADNLLVGRGYYNNNSTGNYTALLRISATAPTAEQIAKMYRDEKPLFQENAQATLYGTSDAVTALAYDDDTELLHAGTSAGRSVFQGLRRVENTTDAVGAAISASNGLVAED
jgi:hypothetical protein